MPSSCAHRGALFPVLFFALLLASPPTRAERSDLDFLMGVSRVGSETSSRLRSDLSWEQSFADEALRLTGTLQTLSMLSESRDFGYSFRFTPVVGLGRHFEGGPTLVLEMEVARQKFMSFLGVRLNFSLWSLRFQSFADASLNQVQKSRLVRLRQQILLPLGAGERREDYLGLSFQFEEDLGPSSSNARLGAGRVVGLVFMSSIEDMF